MEQFYAVTMHGKVLGKITLARRGLYYFVSCCCHLEEKELCRLMVSCGTRDVSLGILVPQGDSFVLCTQIPVKHLGAGEMSFRLVPLNTAHTGKFIPIRPEEPFAYISKLKQSFLVIQNGQMGIETTKMQE